MKNLQIIVGAILLSVSIAISFVSKNAYENNQKIIKEYLDKSKNALDKQDYKEAIKFTKLAIAKDPKNKEAFKLLDEIYKAKFKPSDEEDNDNEEETPSSDEEEEEDMGC